MCFISHKLSKETLKIFNLNEKLVEILISIDSYFGFISDKNILEFQLVL